MENTTTPGPSFSNEAWEELLQQTIGKIKALAGSKGAEYSGDQDRLDNFRRNGERLGLPMEVVWGVYAGKHWDALQTYVKDLNQGRTRTYSEPISGRVDDLLVYLLLFKAMLVEREGPKEVDPRLPIVIDRNGVSDLKFHFCLKCSQAFPIGNYHTCR